MEEKKNIISDYMDINPGDAKRLSVIKGNAAIPSAIMELNITEIFL